MALATKQSLDTVTEFQKDGSRQPQKISKNRVVSALQNITQVHLPHKMISCLLMLPHACLPLW
jgi:hypothetical protein